MSVHRKHVSEILLNTNTMNETYLIHSDTSNPTIIAAKNANDQKPKTSNKCCNKSTCLVVFSCLVTFGIIGGFGFLFGPLVLNKKFALYRFNSSQINVQHYRLSLEPNISTTFSTLNDFQGRASITFTNTRRTFELRLKSQNLNITQVSLTIVNDKYSKILTHFHQINEMGRNYHVGKVVEVQIEKLSELWHGTHTEVVIKLLKPLEINNYLLDVMYTGRYHPMGLSMIKYDDFEGHTKKKKVMSVMNEISMVLPYFNNKQRVRFEVSIKRKTDMSCITNVALRESVIIKESPGLIWDYFKTTPAIFPVSLGIILADYKPIVISTNSIILRILAPSISHNRLSYATQIFPTLFQYFSDYFQINLINFPLPKLDLILIDNYVNILTSKLGLIVLSSKHLLLDTFNDDVDNRRTIFRSLSKAISQQFLQICLNQLDDEELIRGLTIFLAYNAEVDLNQWDSEEIFVDSVMQQSLRKLDEDKGLKIGCVLRMVNETLKGIFFNDGISKFLLNSEDFWFLADQIHLSNNATVKGLLLSWWNNPGYPVVTIIRTTGWNFLIEQEQSDRKSIFSIPIKYISRKQNSTDVHTNGGNVEKFILNKRQLITNLYVPRENWILINYNQIGYYRVNYDINNWNLLINQLYNNPNAIPVLNRGGLISDAFYLADQNQLHWHIPNMLIKYLKRGNEREYFPWKIMVDSLNQHEVVFLDSSDYGSFSKMKMDLLSKLWPTRRRLSPKLKLLIETELCRLQYKPCIEEAHLFYATYKNTKDVAKPHWVYCTVLAHQNEEVFDILYQRLKQNAWNHFEMKVLLKSLACTTSTWKIIGLLEESFHNIHYAKFIWQSVALSPSNRLTGMAFLEAKMSSIQPSNNTTRSYQEQIINTLETHVWKIVIDDFLSTMTAMTHLKMIKKLAHHLEQSLQGSLNKAMARVKSQIEWKQKHLAIFKEKILA